MTKHIKIFVVLVFGLALLSTKATAQDNTTIVKSMTATQSPNDTSKFTPGGKVTAQMFGDYAFKVAGDSAPVATPFKGTGPGYYQVASKSYQAFDFRRIYLGYDYNFTRNFTAQVLLADEPAAIGQGNPVAVTTTGPINGDGTRGIYIKMANFQWKNFFPYAKLTFGQQAPPTFVPFTETLWAYRSIEKTIMDMRAIGSSTDMGIQLSGKFDGDGNFGYSVMIGDGSNKKPEFDKFKKYYASLNGFFFDKKLAVEAYTDYEPSSDSTNKMTMKFFAAYLMDPITIGVEYVQQPSKQTLTVNKVTAATSQDPTGLSIWARGQIIGTTLGYFARYDMWNPDADFTTAYYTETFMTAGLDWQPEANLHIMPNIWIDSYSAKNSAPTRNADVVGRLTFFTKIP
jgi:hypothetical protein